MNLGVSAHLLARLFAVLALAMLTCIPWGWDEPDHGGASSLFVSSGITFAVSLLLLALGRNAEKTVRVREGLFVVSVGWFGAAALSALPFVIDGVIPAFWSAFFEASSGLTTTGASVLTDVEATPRCLLMWRAVMHWLGGGGTVVIFVVLFPQLGVGAKHLFKSEASGPITEGLRPKIKHTALLVWWIYNGLTAANALLLWIAGMSVFDAVAHAMATVATGGFSTRNASVASFESPLIEWITCGFMLLGGTNFALHYAALTGRFRAYVRDEEFRAYMFICALATLACAVVILPRHGGDLEEALRTSAFQVLSISTSTGFATADTTTWPVSLQFVLIFLTVVAACAGSTSGGLKVIRLVLLAKGAFVELYHTARPHAVQAVKLGRSAVRGETLREVHAVAALYGATALFTTAWLTVHGVDLVTAFSATVACISNVGPGFGLAGSMANFAFFTEDAKAVLGVAMLLGRLEFITVLALLLPATWRR